jgi:hypothetical protein
MLSNARLQEGVDAPDVQTECDSSLVEHQVPTTIRLDGGGTFPQRLLAPPVRFPAQDPLPRAQVAATVADGDEHLPPHDAQHCGLRSASSARPEAGPLETQVRR